MALPDAPNTRKEQYLNAIATGSGKPDQPYTREEMYLDYIADNGSGGGGGGSGGGSVLVVNAALNASAEGQLPETLQTIFDAAKVGLVVLVESVEGYGVIAASPANVMFDPGPQIWKVWGAGVNYYAANMTDYPSTDNT